MPDDRSKSRGGRSHWDDERRAAAGKVRRKTPPQGYPVAIDPEATPPPVSVAPQLEAVEGRETWPPGVRESVDMIADNLGDLTAAVGRVWDSRKDSERIDRISGQLETLSKDVTDLAALIREFVAPQVKQHMGRLGQLEIRSERLTAASESFFEREWPHFMQTVAQLDKHLETLATTAQLLGKEVETVKHTVAVTGRTMSQRIEELRSEALVDRTRIIALEQRNRDQDIGDARETALVKRRNRRLKAAWAALTAAGGAIAGWFAGR